ncbi:MAG: GNAT family N-acetyltransferase [Acidimicrobiales bacterium]
MEVTAREAREGDLDVVEALLDAAAADVGTMRGGDVWLLTHPRPSAVRASLQADLAAGDRTLVVGTIDEVVVGYGEAAVAERPGDGTVATVTGLWVLPDARDVGVAEAVMDVLLEWSHGHGAIAIESSVLPGNRAGKNFFERYGLVARAITVRRRLDGADS